MNTVLAVVSWEQTETVEGQFDFTVVDHLLADARSHGMKLALLWFGSWKNGITSYTPTWVKRDTQRFPLAQTPEGKSLPILTTLGDETCKADAKAFAAMMRHLKEADAQQQTVVMIQMENEVGLHGHPRDYCPLAETAYKGTVPQALTGWLTAHRDSLLPETRQAWEAIGYSPFGFERNCDDDANATFRSFYQKVGRITTTVLEAQAEGRIGAAWLKGDNPMRVKDTISLGDVRIVCV